MQYSLPVIVDYDGRKVLGAMGPFERSLERDFSLALNRKAIEECDDITKLKEVSLNLLVGWSNMQEAVGSLVNENLKLRQALGLREADLHAAEQLLNEVAASQRPQGADQSNRRSQSAQSTWRLWPW